METVAGRSAVIRSPISDRHRAFHICLNRCVNCREIGSFSGRFLSSTNWRSASSRSTPDDRGEVDDRAAVDLPELLGVELGEEVLERRADQRLADCASTTRVYLVSDWK